MQCNHESEKKIGISKKKSYLIIYFNHLLLLLLLFTQISTFTVLFVCLFVYFGAILFKYLTATQKYI